MPWILHLPATGAQHGAFVLLINNFVVVSPTGESACGRALIQQPGSEAFREALLPAHRDSYRTGAGWLIAPTWNKILPYSVEQNQRAIDP